MFEMLFRRRLKKILGIFYTKIRLSVLEGNVVLFVVRSFLEIVKKV